MCVERLYVFFKVKTEQIVQPLAHLKESIDRHCISITTNKKLIEMRREWHSQVHYFERKVELNVVRNAKRTPMLIVCFYPSMLSFHAVIIQNQCPKWRSDAADENMIKTVYCRQTDKIIQYIFQFHVFVCIEYIFPKKSKQDMHTCFKLAMHSAYRISTFTLNVTTIYDIVYTCITMRTAMRTTKGTTGGCGKIIIKRFQSDRRAKSGFS